MKKQELINYWINKAMKIRTAIDVRTLENAEEYDKNKAIAEAIAQCAVDLETNVIESDTN